MPASFNFPHTGKLLSLSFILFAGWFADAPVPLSDYPQLALAGLVTFFGSLTAAVPFLLDLFRIPADTFQLFLATGVINSRVGSLVAAVHTLTVALLVSCAVTGHLRWRRGPLLSYAGVTAALVDPGPRRHAPALRHRSAPGVFEGQRAGVDALAPASRSSATVARTLVSGARPRTCRRSRPSTRARCCASGTCRTRCRSRSSISAGDLVGFDVELAHRLAREMGVTLAFVPVDRERLAEQLAEGYCDLVMSGVVVTTKRAREVLFSDSYLDETLAFVVPDDQRDQFASWDAIRDRGALTIAVPDVPYYVASSASCCRAPSSRCTPAASSRCSTPAAARRRAGAAGRTRVGVDARCTRRTPWWCPAPIRSACRSRIRSASATSALATFVNTWIALKRKDGTLDAAYKHWILGQDAAPRQPRWSIVRNVLHWVE